ncbi:FG-GAP-like repeat-containing protein [Dyadobacter sp. LJ53]|uniref:FG-GAP-like repeat-containing protein n=1 Tax=Dyadobacter chenwenxiniae TaxID=2906456 RepID=UPI001F3DAF03|nr:FG-GAP-like repeat-containing protein [Dyadobacter chenwenxiniae]MCF0049858.1 FG-GAP-like repeat-containing protein [Dyadobacter chenwenxiniae]MCF0049936.1 FG-GAP-like repeat-containing protein [Dyadobacter chenwenxiniae]
MQKKYAQKMIPLLACFGCLAFITLKTNPYGWLKAGIFSLPVQEKQNVTTGNDPMKHILASISSQEYHITFNSVKGQLQSPNRAQNLRSSFEPGKLTVENRTGSSSSFRLSLITKGVFADGQKLYRPKSDAVKDLKENELKINHGGYTEEYLNDEKGIRQNFIVHSAPAQTNELEVHLAAEGLQVKDLGNDELEFYSAGNGIGKASSLSYSDLKCWDANGKELESALAYADNQISLKVNVAGAAYPVTIDPLIQNGNPGNANAKLEGEQNDSFLGCSVQSAGDVNGDGYSDVVVGAMGYDDGDADKGAVYVFNGSSEGLSSGTFQKLVGSQAGGFFGSSVSTAGDINGDGYSDVIIGSIGFSNGQAAEGAAFLYAGSAAGLSASPFQTLENNMVAGRMGTSVATAGDVNDDGYSDVIVGIPGYQNGQAGEGAAIIYKGSPLGLDLANAITVESNQINAQLGQSVAGAGDVNGDGYSDIIAGAPLYDNGQVNEGAAFVHLGTALGLKMVPVATIEGNQDNARMGAAVSSTGDSNGDGLSDIAVGAALYDNGENDEGAVFIYNGVLNSGVTANHVHMLQGDQADARCGSALSSAGDVNGDGFADLIIGVPNYDIGELNEGTAFVCLGSPTGLDNGTHGFQSDQADAQMGSSVASAGDVNGDGYSDIIIGASGYDNGLKSNDGTALIFHGSASGIRKEPTVKLGVSQNGAQFGFSVSTAGDVNADGFSDIVVGAPEFDNGAGKEGRVFIYHGSSNGPSNIAATSMMANQAGAKFGFSVSAAGDVNGDGIGDVVVGAPYYDGGQTDEGAVFLYHGSANGIGSSWDTKLESNIGNAFFGWSVAGAGDVNANGFRDIVVGAPGYQKGNLVNSGAAYVFKGSNIGINPLATLMEGNQANAQFGYSVAGAGDVNGDGFNDVVIGAPSYTNGQQSEGVAYIYYGNLQGINNAANSQDVLEADDIQALFGFAVSSAGDVNGDGISDVIVGAPLFKNSAQVADGAAFVFHGSAQGISKAVNAKLQGKQADAHFGGAVSGAGDVNGDGYSDVIIGAPDHDNDQVDEGAAFVYHGAVDGVSTAENIMIESDFAGAKMGKSVSGAGDLNGDGYSDVLVGLTNYEVSVTGPPGSLSGAVFVFQGNYGGSKLRNNLIVYKKDLVTPLGVDLAEATMGEGLSAKSFLGRNSGKMVWETRKEGVAFSQAGTISNSTQFTAQENAYSDLNILGKELKIVADKVGFDTKVRARVRYSPAKAITGQMFGPWRYLPIHTQSSYTIIFRGDVMPVTLISFTAKLIENQVDLNWATATEVNSDRFEIHRSLNGKDWKTIGSVKAMKEKATNSYYSFQDTLVAALHSQNVYYRLKMIDQDDTFTFSSIEAVKLNGKGSKISFFPNPTKNLLSIEAKDKVTSVEIFNANGVKVLSVQNQDGLKTINVAHLQTGSYIVRANDESFTIVKE